jgi:hypothetical protein
MNAKSAARWAGALYFLVIAVAFLALLLRFAEGVVGSSVALVVSIAPLLLLGHESSFDPGQLNALIQFFLDLDAVGINIVLIFMGLGAIIYFYLFLKSKLIPTALAIWGLITYLIMFVLGLANLLFPTIPETVSMILFAPGSIFELVIGLWLLIKGVGTDESDLKGHPPDFGPKFGPNKGTSDRG